MFIQRSCLLLVLISTYPFHMGLHCWLSDKEPACQCGRHRFNLWVWKVPWRIKWQPTPVLLPGESHGQRSWQATVHGVSKSQTWLSDYYSLSLTQFFYVSFDVYLCFLFCFVLFIFLTEVYLIHNIVLDHSKVIQLYIYVCVCVYIKYILFQILFHCGLL